MNNVPVIIYVILSLIVIGVLSGLLIRCQMQNKEGLCICSGAQRPGTETCVNTERLQDAYYSGKFLPEFAAV